MNRQHKKTLCKIVLFFLVFCLVLKCSLYLAVGAAFYLTFRIVNAR
jgi:hypothetical protein